MITALLYCCCVAVVYVVKIVGNAVVDFTIVGVVVIDV